MRYIESSSTDPAWNLALEEYVFECMDKRQSYVMLWQNANSVIIGKNQNTAQEINADYVRSHHVKVVRRLSGGGAVYHDLGNLNYTFITDAENMKIDFGAFCRPVLKALLEMGVEAEISGRNDLTVGGRKFSGNAQYVKNGRVVHHGTLLFESNLDVVQRVLNVNAEKIASKGVSSVHSRIVNLKEYLPDGMTMGDFRSRIRDHLLCGENTEAIQLDEKDLIEIERIKSSCYDSWQWNYGASPVYTAYYNRRIEGCGQFDIYLTVERGTIKSACIRGDFFGSRDIAGLEQLICGCELRRQSLAAVLENIDIQQYISGCSLKDFASLICP